MQLNGALSDHATWSRLAPDLSEPGKFFSLERQQSNNIPIFELGRLLSYTIGRSKVRV